MRAQVKISYYMPTWLPSIKTFYYYYFYYYYLFGAQGDFQGGPVLGSIPGSTLGYDGS